MIKNIFQLIKYSMVGGINTLIHLVVMNILMYVSGTYTGNLLFFFEILAFLIYTTTGFFLNRKFTFKADKNNNAYFRYLFVMAPSALCNAFIIRTFTLYNFFSLPKEAWANIVIISSSILVGLFSFIINKLFVFK